MLTNPKLIEKLKEEIKYLDIISSSDPEKVKEFLRRQRERKRIENKILRNLEKEQTSTD